MTEKEITQLERNSCSMFVPRVAWDRYGWRALVSVIPNRRANAAYPLVEVPDPEAVVEEVTAFYRLHARVPRFKLTPATPNSVRAALATGGMQPTYGADVMIRSLTGSSDRSRRVTIADHLTDDWLDLFQRGRLVDRTATRHAYQAPGSDIGAASLGEDAIGLGIVRGGWLGIFNMFTDRDVRRQGRAGEILDALTAWGVTRGATMAYLQVVVENIPAQRLYTGRGFQFAYAYEYWAKPDQPGIR